VPRISGKSVQLHPALVMMVLVIGGQLAGFWGMLIAVPLTAIIRDVFLYLYLRLLDDPLSPQQAVARLRSEEKVVLEA
jgi:predicted PurR-regulated permease PerM